MDGPKDIGHFARPAVRGQIGKGLGEGAPSIGAVRKAVGRLTRGDILVRVERGEYHVQDGVFLEWLKRPTGRAV